MNFGIFTMVPTWTQGLSKWPIIKKINPVFIIIDQCLFLKTNKFCRFFQTKVYWENSVFIIVQM